MGLLRAWPGACAERDPDGCLPLHFAVQSFASKSVLRALLDAHPDAVKDADTDGLLPLHVALEHQVPPPRLRSDPHPTVRPPPPTTHTLPRRPPPWR